MKINVSYAKLKEKKATTNSSICTSKTRKASLAFVCVKEN